MYKMLSLIGRFTAGCWMTVHGPWLAPSAQTTRVPGLSPSFRTADLVIMRCKGIQCIGASEGKLANSDDMSIRLSRSGHTRIVDGITKEVGRWEGVVIRSATGLGQPQRRPCEPQPSHSGRFTWPTVCYSNGSAHGHGTSGTRSSKYFGIEAHEQLLTPSPTVPGQTV